VVPRFARLGMLAGLSQAAIKVASPGVPDYYQGTELWDYSLVDPDNRRPVDYDLRKKFLGKTEKPEDLLAHLADGKAKMHVIREGLRLRKEMPELFYEPSYTPLYADGGKEENICAFALSSMEKSLVVVAPRLFAGMVADENGAPLGDLWGDAVLALPPGVYENVLTGEKHQCTEGRVRLAGLLKRFPVALLATMKP
jgi:(1->4)-alpha-D-glucan 1-alpha-D-glucosylmutase